MHLKLASFENINVSEEIRKSLVRIDSIDLLNAHPLVRRHTWHTRPSFAFARPPVHFVQPAHPPVVAAGQFDSRAQAKRSPRPVHSGGPRCAGAVEGGRAHGST